MVRPLLPLLLLVWVGCSGQDAVDAAVDEGVDASHDSATADGGVDAGSDAGVPTCDAGPPIDAGGVVYTEMRAPCADRDPLRHVYFGDLHVHTARSFDSWALGNRTLPMDAYRFARGEAVEVYGGPMGVTRTVQLTRPLDFAAVTDHSELLGEVNICLDPTAAGYASSTCEMYRGGGTVGFAVLGLPIVSAAASMRDRTICGAGNADCTAHAMQVWQDEQAAAEAAYDRTSACRFTSFVAYEWTSTPNGDNLHRNVIFRNAHVPDAPVSIFEAPTPPELWQRLHAVCNACNACEDVVIPHNSNLSAGNMFSLSYLDGLDASTRHDALTLRAQTELLVEMTQHKGTSECLNDVGLGASDEECAFELERTSLLGGPTGAMMQPLCNGDGSGAGVNCVSRDSYVRNALAEGLAEETRSGVNPFRLGFIGSTDTHNGTPGNVDEATFEGHLAGQDFGPLMLTQNAPGGIAAVWAVENSRDAIFEALARRETYATSGPRIVLRTFGGFGWDASLCGDAMLVTRGYAEGVPMGGTLDASAAAGRAPSFVVQAMQDRSPLARAQIVKGWADAAGAPHTQVYDVGTPATGTLDTTTCTAGGGTSSICEVWTDPDFDPHVPAVYYARVLEVPTCRWTQYQCNAMPAASRPVACTDGSVTLTLEERAWSSPIWVTPG